MGNDKSKVNMSKSRRQDWEQCRIPSIHQRKLLVNKNNPTMFIQDSYAQIFSDKEYKNANLLYNMSNQGQQSISIKFINFENMDRLCSRTGVAHIYTERIDLRLGDVGKIPFPDILHVYNQCFNGYLKLKNIFGCFRVNSNCIGINQQNKIKVWFRDDFSCIIPSEPTNLQHQMIYSILNTIQKHVDTSSMPKREPSIRDFVANCNKLNFIQVINKFRQYCRIYNNAQIPNNIRKLQKQNTSTIQRQQRIMTQPNISIPIHTQEKQYNFLQNAVQCPRINPQSYQQQNNFINNRPNINIVRPTQLNSILSRQTYQRANLSSDIRRYSNQNLSKINKNANNLVHKQSPTRINVTYQNPSANSSREMTSNQKKSIITTMANSPLQNQSKINQKLQGERYFKTPKNDRKTTDNLLNTTNRYYPSNNNNQYNKSPDVYSYAASNRATSPNPLSKVQPNEYMKKNSVNIDNFIQKTFKMPITQPLRTVSQKKISQNTNKQLPIDQIIKGTDIKRQKQKQPMTNLNKPPLPKKFDSNQLYKARLAQSRVKVEGTSSQTQKFPQSPIYSRLTKRQTNIMTRNKQPNQFYNQNYSFKDIKAAQSVIQYNQPSIYSQKILPKIAQHQKSSNQSDCSNKGPKNTQRTFYRQRNDTIKRNPSIKDSMALYNIQNLGNYGAGNSQNQYKVDIDPELLADIRANAYNL